MINESNNESGNKASSGSEVLCTTTVFPHSPRTTRANVAAEDETTHSQYEEEAVVSGNEENIEEEKSRGEASGSDSDEEGSEKADSIERFTASKESDPVARRALVDFLRNR